MPTPRDEFDDPEGFFSRLITLSDQGRNALTDNKSLVISAAVFVTVVALSGVIWASYPGQNDVASDGAVPVIRADAESYKYVPNERGGMEIAYKDSTIFDAMHSGNPDGKVENLLSNDDEKPLDRQELFAGLKTDLKDAGATAASDETQVAQIGDYAQQRPMTESERRAEAARRNRELLSQEAAPLPGDAATDKPSKAASAGMLSAEEVKPDVSNEDGSDEAAAAAVPATPVTPSKGFQEKVTPAPTPSVVTELPPETPVTPAAPAPKPVVKAAEKPAQPSPSPAKIATGTGDSYVQVMSVPDAAKVPGEWNALTAKLPMLSGMPYRIQAANLGAKGTFHRVQVGPMSKDAATQLCNSIKAKKPGGCLVTK